MFFVRADGNEQIGMGHIMRCLNIAAALQSQGEEVCFLLADDKPQKLIEERGFQTRILFTYYDEMDVELPQLMMLFSQYPGAKILVDSYFVTEFYLNNLRLVTKVVLMDDVKSRILPCDALINYNIYGDLLGYEKDYPDDVTLLTGLSYMPLRDVFIGKEALIRDHVSHIMLTTGGSDSLHVALSYVKHLSQLPSYQQIEKDEELPTWHIICGPYCEDTEELKKLEKEYPWMKVHTGLTDLSEMMLQCDLAVSAAGSTLYELSALGLPTVGFYYVDNQRQNMETFGKITPIVNAGDFSVAPELVMSNLDRVIGVISESKELREKMHLALRSIVDGKGAERLAERLLAL